jgi:hypothetical protein
MFFEDLEVFISATVGASRFTAGNVLTKTVS